MNSVHHNTDADLITSLNRGDRDAFETIYNTYAAELFRVIQRSVTVREDCEEILQDVFEHLWTRHKDLNIITLRPYLHRMVYNRMAGYFRHNKVKEKYERHFRLFETLYDQLDEAEIIDSDTFQSLINNSLQDLPDRCQTAFKLRLSGYTNGEIADSMNIRKGTVENYIVKALAHLRTSYRNYCKAGYL